MAELKTEDRLKLAWKQWYENPENKQLSTKLMNEFTPIINSFITTYLGASYVNDPLIQGRAKTVLFESLGKYDPTKGSLTTFAWTNLQRLQRYMSKHQNVLHMSEQSIMLSKALNEATERLRESLGREPSDQELADNLGISIKRIETIRKRQQVGYEGSFEEATGEDSASLPAAKKAKDLQYLYNVYYDALEDNKDKYILESTFGLHGKPKKTISEIAKDLNISRNNVNQRLNKIREDFKVLTQTATSGSSIDLELE
jgi:RNA polymerase primary sigma factor